MSSLSQNPPIEPRVGCTHLHCGLYLVLAGQAMKKWFRRLSSKELKPAGSYDHNEYSSSNRLDIAQGVGASNSVNPALSAAKLRETAPEQRHSNSSVERDLQLSQNAAFECYLAESVPQSSSAPARRLSSGALGSTGYASASAPSNHRQQDTRGHKQRLSGSIYDSSDADSILSTQHDVHQRYKPLQDTTHQSQHAALTSHRSGCSSASGTSRHGRPEHSVQYSNSIPQSIYRSHDLDILSSGGQAFDRDPILSTAPSADWLWEETVQRQPPTHQPGSQRHYRARAHHRAQYSPKPPRAKHADFLPSPRNSVRLTDVLSRAPSMPPQQKHGMHIPSIHERFDTQHAASPIVTPFAKHAHGSTGRSMGSQDLDTAMRGAARAYSHQVGMQANGSLGKPLSSSLTCDALVGEPSKTPGRQEHLSLLESIQGC